MKRGYRFGLFEFDIDSRQLAREGRPVHLQAQPAQVLACLLEAGGETVSRDELRHVVWPDGTYVDFDRGLNFCIAQTRSALDDDAASPRYIRTLPKRGYQFIAPVTSVGMAEAPPVQRNSRPALRRVAAIAAAALLVVLGSVGYWRYVQGTASPIVAVLRFDNETGNPGQSAFADSLTDNVVVDLTSAGAGRYRVIGNAQLLRRAREQRDLVAVGRELGASYVILGQVQQNGASRRILAHLIHLPDQTHVSVFRLEPAAADSDSALETSAARSIAERFSSRIGRAANR